MICFLPDSAGAMSVVAVPQPGQLFVQWVQVANAASYQIDFRSVGAIGWNPAAASTTTACGIAVSGLTDGSPYEVRVTAKASDLSTLDTGIATAVPGPDSPTRWYCQILQGGQSLSLGTQGAPALTTSQPYGNLMLDTPLLAPAANLIPLVEPHSGANFHVEETTASGMANRLSSEVPDFTSVVTLHGLGTASYIELKKDTLPYLWALTQMRTVHSHAIVAGRANRVGGISMIHGETDDAMGITAEQYAGFLLQWQRDYEGDVRAFTGQEEWVPMFIDQPTSWTGNTHTFPRIELGQLSAARTLDSRIRLVMPTYSLEFADNLHLKAWSYRRMGEYFGRAMKKTIVDGEEWRPLMPLRVARLGRVIEVQFHVPAPPLAFDTSAVVAKPQFGFEFSDSTSSATIESAAIISSDTVRITLDQTPTGAQPRLRYAYTGTSGIVGPRDAGAPSGNLRDSDLTPALYHDAHVPAWADSHLRNWCVTFDDPIADATPLMAWRQQHFGKLLSTAEAADLADPDHDGMCNLAEFATQSDPATTSSLPLAPVADAATPTIEYVQRSGGTGTHGIDYAAAGVATMVEVSSDNLTWHSGPTFIEPEGPATDLGSGLERIKVRVAAGAFTTTARLFFRLKFVTSD